MNEYATKNDVQEIDTKLDLTVDRLEKKIDQAVTDLSDIIANFAQQVDDRFNKVEVDIFKIQQDFAEMRLQNIEIRDSLYKLSNTIDGFIGRIDAYETEQTARDAQFARLLEWAKEVSKKTGIPLKGF